VDVVVLDPPSWTLPYDHALSAALARRGHTVRLLVSPFVHGSSPEPDGYVREDVYLPLSGRLLKGRKRSRVGVVLKGAEYAPSALRGARRIEKLAPDVAHVQWLGYPRFDRFWLRRVAHRRPTVLTAHEVLPQRTASQVGAWRDVFATVDRVVAHTAGSAGRLAELGVEPAKIVEIPHPAFESANARPIAPPTGQTLLFFGLIRRYKGLDVLIRALPQVAAALPEARLVVAGDPLEPVEPLRELAAGLGVDGLIDWRLGYVPGDRIPALMDSATVVVLPYRRIEASGVLADAVGHGRPAVVSDVGAIGETVRRFGAGEAVPPEDPEALAAACVRLLGDERRLAEAFAGVKAARKALTWDAAAEAHEQLYDEIARR
jgi:glycosyltransferase involved in cell wall biosynthesis